MRADEYFALQYIKDIRKEDPGIGGMMTPSEAAESTGERDMKWTSYRHLAIKFRDNLDIPENSLPLPTSNGSPSGLRPSVNPLQ